MMRGVPAVVRATLPDSELARLKARLETMPVIEQAKGILMAREGCGPEEAFDLLRRASQRANVKVHAMAAVLVEQVGTGMGDDPGNQVSPPPRAGHGRKLAELPERAEAVFLVSAAQLRADGMPGPARRFEQFADRVRLDLDHPQPAPLPRPGTLLDEILAFGLELLHADRGNVQLVDPATGALQIAAQRGFGPEFLDYFAVVADDGSACGRAAWRAAQVVIADVTTDPGFAPHRDIAAASGFRAVQSTPLTDQSGHLVGMVSTHYPRPLSLPGRELQIMARFGTLIGTSLGLLLNAAQPAPGPLDRRNGHLAAGQDGRHAAPAPPA
jgi:hypothetical protein